MITNLARAFPDKKYSEIKEIAKKAYEHLGKIFTEAIWFGGCSGRPERLHKSHIVTLDNPEVLNRIHELGHSIMIASSHCGNWEIYGGFEHYTYSEPLKYTEADLCMPYRRQHSPTWDRFLLHNRKSILADKNHDGLVESLDIMKFAFRNRHKNRLYFFIADQYPYRKSSRTQVEFMHQPTWVMDGIAQLAHTMGMAFAYLSMKETPDGNYVMHLTPLSEDASKDDPQELLQKYFTLLQKDLEEQPWNYLWTHKRWK